LQHKLLQCHHVSPNSHTNSLAHHVRPNASTDDLNPHPNPDNTTNNFKANKRTHLLANGVPNMPK